MLINTHSYYEYSFSQPPLHLENEVFLLPSFSEKERLECSLFASGGNAVSGIGGGSNVEDTAIEEEELLTVGAETAVQTMVLCAGQFSRDNNQVVLGAVLISLC